MVKSIGVESIKWGVMMADDDDYKMYKSFVYRGVEYSTFDSVYTLSDRAKETDIGKITKIWETKEGRKVKLCWFFRPGDVCKFLGDYRPSWNELFLAAGDGKGVSNTIPLEAIIGKCNVICTSNDRRNTSPSMSDIAKADYFFSHVFDVNSMKLSEKLPDIIDCVKVERLLNRVAVQPKAIVERNRASQTEVDSKDCDVKEESFRMFEQLTPENQPLKKMKISESDSADAAYGVFSDKPQMSFTDKKWYLDLPWEKKVLVAHERRTLVTLINLDPSYTSSDVQDMISFAFNLKVDARIMPHRSFSSPLCGQAFVIFNSAYEANNVVSELNKRCLVDEEGRPVVAFKTILKEPLKSNYFPGHIMLELYDKKKRTSKGKALSTSHCAQQNTIESQMATEWILLQKRSDLSYEALYKEQAEEMSEWLKKLKTERDSIVKVETSIVKVDTSDTCSRSIGGLHVSD